MMKITVIGAGHGGQALAGYLAYCGCSITIYNRTKSVIDGIKKNRGCSLRGIITEDNIPVISTNDIQFAVESADIIMICVPAMAHADIAKLISPYVNEKHIVILNPGRTLGAYYFKKILIDLGVNRVPLIAETDTFILTSRKISDGVSVIMSLKNVVYLAAEAKRDSEKICSLLSPILPMLTPAESQIYTSLSNIGAIFHPIPAIFNIGRIECNEEYLHYKEGITPSICHLLELVDSERIELAHALNVVVPSAKEWLFSVYHSKGSSLYEALQNTDVYNTVKAPTSINTRYIYEDITTGIVPMYCLAKSIGTNYEMLELVIELATKMFSYDFYENGRHDVENFLESIE